MWNLQSNWFVYERENVECVFVCTLCICTRRHTEIHLQKNLPDRHTHTHITTHKLQSVDVGKIWFVSFCYCVWSIWLQPRFAILQKNPATFKEVRNKPRGVSDPALCWCLLQKTVKTLSSWTPVVLHIFVMDNGRLSQSVPSPPLARKRRAGISYLSRKKLLAYSAKS